MPKVDITDNKGMVVSMQGTGFYLNGTQVQASATSLNRVQLYGRLADITTPSGTYLACPIAGEVVRLYVTNSKALVSADGTPAITVAAGDGTSSSYTTIGTLTFGAEDAVGSVVDSGAITSNNTVVAGGVIKITSNGGSGTGNAVSGWLTVVIQRT